MSPKQVNHEAHLLLVTYQPINLSNQETVFCHPYNMGAQNRYSHVGFCLNMNVEWDICLVRVGLGYDGLFRCDVR